MTMKASTERVKNVLAKKAQQKEEIKLTPNVKMQNLLNKMLPEIEKAIGKVMTADRFARIALTLYNSNELFYSADTKSFLACLMQSAQSGLEPNTVLGEAYIVPYKNNKQGTVEVSFQLGYKGLLKLAHNSGQFEAIYAHEVREGDRFEYSYGLNKDLIHVPADIPSNKVTHYYAVYKLKNGGFDFVVWSKERVEQHAKTFSKQYTYKGAINNNSIWAKNFDSMAKKTVIIDVLKYAPKSVEMARAIQEDYKADTTEEVQEFNTIDIDKVELEQDSITVDYNEVVE